MAQTTACQITAEDVERLEQYLVVRGERAEPFVGIYEHRRRAVPRPAAHYLGAAPGPLAIRARVAGIV